MYLRHTCLTLLLLSHYRRCNLFRTAYMGERLTYGTRRQQAMSYPSEFISLISDGMAQIHCELPWYANNKDVDCKLTQHLQGVLCHGRSLTIYRTFENVRTGTNLAIHSFLSVLDDTLKREGRLPDTIFHQVCLPSSFHIILF